MTDTQSISRNSDDHPSILVVDDDPNVLLLTSEILDTEGFHCLLAANVAEAEKVLEHDRVDLILLDLVMPGIPGVDFLNDLRLSHPHVPVIVVTGKGGVDPAVQCFRNGAVDFLTKPVMPADLVRIVDSHLTVRPVEHLARIGSGKMAFIPGFRVIGTLGEGNMGVVYHVESDKKCFGRTEFALKVLKLPIATDSDVAFNLRQRFKKEAKAACGIDHPNIIKVFDHGVDAHGTPYIIMELFRGRSLGELIQKPRLSTREKCQILEQAAFALASIHDNNICHRDLKPANVMVDNDLHVKITDFGIARLPDSSLTPTSQVFGSPSYLSPEAFTSAKVDFSSDLFSFGTLAYELFSGEVPFKGNTVGAVAYAIRNDIPVPLRKVVPGFPKRLGAIVTKLLEKSPSNRYASAFELYEDLHAFTEGFNSNGWQHAIEWIRGKLQ